MRTLWRLLDIEVKLEILVACGVNNRLYKCQECPGFPFKPDCGYTHCVPCKKDGTEYPMKIKNDRTVLDEVEPHTYFLVDKDFDSFEKSLQEKVAGLLRSLD